jgi:hypothetical protein
VTFVRQVGFYLIEMNSGRLRGGAERYRTLMARLRTAGKPASDAATPAGPPSEEPLEVVLAVVGQVKSGKSSLINALLGEHRAAMDVLPTTQQVRRHQLEWAATRDRLVLLDTPGYGGQGLNDAQLRETQAALRTADLVLLVMNAANPARQADLRTLRELSEWFARDARRRPTPVLGILTHIDLLSPVLEWTPPYDWQHPTSAKERNIQAAVEHHRATFGDRLAGVVPVCTDVQRQRVAGIEEHLLPAMLAVLGEARACSLLRTLHDESNRGQVSRLVEQLCRAGAELLRSQWPS